MSSREVVYRPPGIGEAARLQAISPAPFYLTGEDRLRLIAYNTLAGVAVKMHARFATRGGETKVQGWKLIPSTDRNPVALDVAIGDGALLNVTVFSEGSTPLLGQTFCVVQLVRGSGAVALVVATILAGFVTASQPLGYPGSPILASTEGLGCPRYVAGTQPAAGAQIQELAPTNGRWQLVRLFAVFSTSATAANRIVRFKMVSLGAGTTVVTHTTAQTASLQFWYTFAPGIALSFDPISLTATLPIPNDAVLLSGHSFLTDVANMQAGDAWSTPQFLVREWLEANSDVSIFA